MVRDLGNLIWRKERSSSVLAVGILSLQVQTTRLYAVAMTLGCGQSLWLGKRVIRDLESVAVADILWLGGDKVVS